MEASRALRAQSSHPPLPGTSTRSRCPTCPGGAAPDRQPTLMGGTGIVEVQRWRCDRDSSHWWDEFRPIVDLPSDQLGGRRSPELLPDASTNLPRASPTAIRG